MKYFVSVFVLALFGFGAEAATGGARPAMANKIMSAPRYTASVNQLNGTVPTNGVVTTTTVVSSQTDTTSQETVEEEEEEKVDMREAERNACINNNIGVGNTFVWASRYSDTSNYASMVEDVEHPENNVCFVRVELASSNESRVKVSDIEPKYFEWGEPIKCGSWVSKKEMEKRILDAKKGVRIGGIVASTVGGIGVGVGAMELFGNKLIGGKVQGQKGVSEKKLYKEQLVAMKKKNDPSFSTYKANLEEMVSACKDSEYRLLIDDCSLYEELWSAVK